MALDADYSIPEEHAREMRAQIVAKKEAKDRPFMDEPFCGCWRLAECGCAAFGGRAC